MKKRSILAVTLTALWAVNTNAADITVENFAGKQVVPENPQRVAVLDFAALDTMRQLGVKDRVVGTIKGKVPAYLSEFKDEKYANMGTAPEPAFENINDVKPDLIIASTRQKKALARLKEIAPVFYIENDYTNYYPSLQQNILAIGKIFNKEAQAKEKLAALDKRISALASLAKGKTALMTLVNESRISAFGQNSRYAMVYQNFGFTPIDTNLTGSTHGNSIGFEYIAEKNPDYLLVVDRTAAITDKANNAQTVLNNEIVNKTNAAKNHHIVYLNAENWYLTFGGLESMDKMVTELESAVK
ncbi:iron complex transport system substrate-binding protein [Pasteurella langaaensis DSM 22999]|uniref:Iron complex transport system substrate-binding protein n=1 Tax=Alitibacter langaaensis DSM 22999 TaxID=1122935 RepID=A0A2U0T8D4_9PAST|nr:siderophore ABC transporter substrate-binding protein [Pasteurella langaaensis]PVX39828.1 iron complex transport system substrate-binding protein [Pasteurella langaaensis DSM 22999]